MKYSLNAISAKVKAIFGNRLKEEDYKILINKKSVVDIATYLKNETYYRYVLKGINEKAIHRGQLEELLHKDIFDQYFRLLRYANHSTSSFFQYYIKRIEIKQILACIQAFHYPDDEHKIYFISKIPTYIDRYTSFNLNELANVHDFKALQKLLQPTDYFRLIEPFVVEDMEQFDHKGCEAKFDECFYNLILKMIDQNFSGRDHQAAKDIFLTQIELDNISKIYRLKKYFNYTGEMILPLLIPLYHHIPKKKMQDLIYNLEPEKILETLKDSYYRNYFQEDKFQYIELRQKSIMYYLNKKHLAFNNNPQIVLLTFMMYKDLEVHNLVEIIEGVRYQLPPERIAKLLIY